MPMLGYKNTVEFCAVQNTIFHTHGELKFCWKTLPFAVQLSLWWEAQEWPRSQFRTGGRVACKETYLLTDKLGLGPRPSYGCPLVIDVYLHTDKWRRNRLFHKHIVTSRQVGELQKTIGPVSEGDSLGGRLLRIDTKLRKSIKIIFLKEKNRFEEIINKHK